MAFINEDGWGNQRFIRVLPQQRLTNRVFEGQVHRFSFCNQLNIQPVEIPGIDAGIVYEDISNSGIRTRQDRHISKFCLRGRSGWSLHTLDALLTLRSRFACRALGAIVAIGTVNTRRALLAARTLNALLALDALNTLRAGVALRPLDALLALDALNTLRTGCSLRPCRTCGADFALAGKRNSQHRSGENVDCASHVMPPFEY